MVEWKKVWYDLGDPAECEILVKFFEEKGIPQAQWKDADDIKEECDSPCLVLLDSGRGGPNAYELGTRLSRNGKADVVIVTGRDFAKEGEMIARALHLDILARPLSPEKLERLYAGDLWKSRRVSVDALSYLAERNLDEEEFSEKVLRGLQMEDFPGKDFIKTLIDPETGLYHQHFMVFRLEEELKRARRFDIPLSIVLIKLFIEGKGEECPSLDTILSVSGKLLGETRDIDSLGRWSKDSFLLVLPGTPVSGAASMLRRLFPEREPITGTGEGEWKLAAGIAGAPSPHVLRWRDLLEGAERSLQKAFSNFPLDAHMALGDPGY